MRGGPGKKRAARCCVGAAASRFLVWGLLLAARSAATTAARKPPVVRPALTRRLDDCVNDDSTSDEDGDTCTGFYDSHGDRVCGCCDDDDFTASVQCCVCRGHLGIQKLTASDAGPSDRFGRSVAIDGNTVVIGAYYHDGTASNSGAAYVFRTDDGGATYVEGEKLAASDAAGDDNFGYSVAIDGTIIVIGAYKKNDDTGAVYIFRESENTYAQVAKLTASDAASEHKFGWSVAIAGNTVVVGAYKRNNYTGAVYIFRTTDGGNTYAEADILTASDAAMDSSFGYSVAIDGNTVVVGAYKKDDYTGAAYVFRASDEGNTYTEVDLLTAADAAAFDYFGCSVALDGGTVVVGAYRKDDYTGAVYVYRTSDGGATYGKVGILTAADGASGSRFGYAVAIDGNVVATGADSFDDNRGAVYIFSTSDGGATYGHVEKLMATDALDDDKKFGTSVAVQNGLVAIGARYDGDKSGAAYLFELPAETTPRPTPRPPLPRPTPSPTPRANSRSSAGGSTTSSDVAAAAGGAAAGVISLLAAGALLYFYRRSNGSSANRRTVRGGDDRSCLELGGGAEETLPPLLVDAGCHKGASQ